MEDYKITQYIVVIIFIPFALFVMYFSLIFVADASQDTTEFYCTDDYQFKVRKYENPENEGYKDYTFVEYVISLLD